MVDHPIDHNRSTGSINHPIDHDRSIKSIDHPINHGRSFNLSWWIGWSIDHINLSWSIDYIDISWSIKWSTMINWMIYQSYWSIIIDRIDHPIDHDKSIGSINRPSDQS
jgi:hypothetical protein